MKSVNWHKPLFIIPLLALAACSSNDPAPTAQDVAIQFAAKVNGADYACGQTYANVGTGPHDYTVNDFRLYVHNAHIHDHNSGETYTIELDQDGVWQQDNLALLDFENNCTGSGGTSETNTSLRGSVTVPTTVDMANTEVCFELGVPASLNHQDSTVADAPLNLTTMQWNWLVGYKYVRIDGFGDPNNANNPFNIHLGAQGCPAGANGTSGPPTAACSVPNTVEVCVDGFNVASSRIAVDAGAVLAGNDISVNLNGAATARPGCMSFVDDADCIEVMPRLGLDYSYGSVNTTMAASAEPIQQKMFSRE